MDSNRTDGEDGNAQVSRSQERDAAETTSADTGPSETEPAPPVEGYVETRGPPAFAAAFKVINPIMKAVLRSPLHGLVSDSLLLLTFTGRKSGTEYSTPVGYWREGDKVIVSTHSPWWRNLRGGAPVRVLLAGRERRGTATPHDDAETVARYMQRFIDQRGVDAAARIGISIDGDREPTLAELEAGVAGTVVIEIELDEPA